MLLRLLNAALLKIVLAKLIGTSLRKVGTINRCTMRKPKNSHYFGYICAPFPYNSVRKATYVLQCFFSNVTTCPLWTSWPPLPVVAEV
jgi:hypothetical protein